jgi:hypothetical protein
MIRPRKKGKPAVPNLYEDDGYYSWRHPVTGKTFGLGRNRSAAVHQAIEANLHVEELIAKPRLLDRLTDDADRTVKSWVEQFEDDLADRDYKPATERLARAMGRAVVKAHGEFLVARWTPLHVSNLVKSYAKAGKRQMALQLRSYLIDLCGEAVNAGWLQTNIAANIRSPKVTVQRSRLDLESFLSIYRKAGEIHILGSRGLWSLRSLPVKGGKTSARSSSRRPRRLSPGWTALGLGSCSRNLRPTTARAWRSRYHFGYKQLTGRLAKW